MPLARETGEIDDHETGLRRGSIAGRRTLTDVLHRDARPAAGRARAIRGLGRRDVLRDLGTGEDGHGVRAAKERASALHVDDVAAAREALEARGVAFTGEIL